MRSAKQAVKELIRSAGQKRADVIVVIPFPGDDEQTFSVTPATKPSYTVAKRLIKAFMTPHKIMVFKQHPTDPELYKIWVPDRCGELFCVTQIHNVDPTWATQMGIPDKKEQHLQ